ncbi:MAG: 16S rRNA (uracil(1498)-N(3))-methyltransferase [Betaproteobacteria bacterium]
MATPRFFVPDLPGSHEMGSQSTLPEAAAHHAVRVLRLEVGDAITLFTGNGGEIAATIVHAGKRDAIVRIDGFDPVDRDAPLAVTLVQAIPANDAMDYAVRKAVELGVAAIAPIVSTQGARFPDGERGEKRMAHWQQIAIAACEQCGRNRVPLVAAPQPFDDWLAKRDASRAGMMLAPNATLTLPAMTPPVGTLDVLIGPEGGFNARESEHALNAGIVTVRLGPRILRTETAVSAALAAINLLWSDFR